MPAVNPIKLKKLMTLELLLPFALRRKLSGAQLEDLAKRAMSDNRFDLSGYSDEFAGYMNEDQATDWAEEFERTGVAPHLFAIEASGTSKPEEKFGNLPMSQVEEMSAEARLRLANKVADEQRHAKKKQ